MFQSTPLSLLAHADKLRPTIAATDWRLDTPRHGGQSHVLVMAEGSATLLLATGQLRATAPALVWMPPGAAHRISLASGSSGTVLSLSENLVSMAIGAGGQSSSLRATADRLVLAERLKDGDVRFAALAMAAETIHYELRNPREAGVELVAACTSIILVAALRLSPQTPMARATDWSPPQLLQRFMQMVEVHFREQYAIRRYADELGVTERRLHDTVVKATGRSPLALVHARMVEEAQERLSKSSLPIAQIGYGLGFRDPAHFTRFFVRTVGTSPRRYRADLRSARLPETFAAWP